MGRDLLMLLTEISPLDFPSQAYLKRSFIIRTKNQSLRFLEAVLKWPEKNIVNSPGLWMYMVSYKVWVERFMEI